MSDLFTDHANVQTTTEERLARWDALGRALAARGPQWLSVAHELASARTHCNSHLSDPTNLDAAEVERLADLFVADCAIFIDRGGALALWHLIVADAVTPSGATAELNAEALERDGQLAAARSYAIAALVTANRHEIEDMRDVLAGDVDLEDFAPFASKAVQGPDDSDGEPLISSSAAALARATTDAERLAAIEDYAYGVGERAKDFTPTPAARMGLVAWFARREVKQSEEDVLDMRWRLVGAQLRERSPEVFGRVRALVEACVAGETVELETVGTEVIQ